LGRILVAFDEVSFQLMTNYKRIWFPKGETPKGAFFWSNKKLIAFGALTSTHNFYHEFHIAQNTITFYSFLSSFIELLEKDKKYVFILDNVGFHKTAPIINLLEKYQDIISVEFLPTYSPELNPIETCWKVTKNAVTKSQYFPTIDDMQGALESFWKQHTFMQNFITYLCP
jgi:transposase